jgi:hypothetical protein
MSTVTRQCSISWLHTSHEWSDGGERCYCPGVWGHPLPDPDEDEPVFTVRSR